LLEAVPAVVFEVAQLVAIPEPVLAVLALHFGVVAVEADGCFVVLLFFEESTGGPSVEAITGATAPTAFPVGSANAGELAAAVGIPVIAESEVVAEVNFSGFAVFGFLEGNSMLAP
jgi:hypothetical protein